MTADKILRTSDGISIRDYVDLRFEESHRALCKAEETMNRRLAGMNEFRETLKDQAGRFVTRDELTLMMRPICDDIRMLRELSAESKGKASLISVAITAVISIAGLILGFIHLLK